MDDDQFHRESTDRIAIVSMGALALVAVGFVIGIAIVLVLRAFGVGCV